MKEYKAYHDHLPLDQGRASAWIHWSISSTLQLNSRLRIRRQSFELCPPQTLSSRPMMQWGKKANVTANSTAKWSGKWLLASKGSKCRNMKGEASKKAVDDGGRDVEESKWCKSIRFQGEGSDHVTLPFRCTETSESKTLYRNRKNRGKATRSGSARAQGQER